MTSHQTPVDGLLRHYETDPARGLTAEQHIGDPTETSIIVAAHKNGLEQGAMTQQYPRLAELPFDSDRKPKPKDESLFAHGLGLRIVLQGVMFALLSLAAFAIGEAYTGMEAGGQTMAFMVLSLSQIVQAFNMRSEHSLFHIGPFTNHKLNWACLISVLLVALVLFTPVGILFELVSLSPQLYLVGLGLALVPVIVMELSKKFGLIKHQH